MSAAHAGTLRKFQIIVGWLVLRRVAPRERCGCVAQSVCDHATLFIEIAAEDEKFRRGQDHAAMVFGNSTYASAIAAAEPICSQRSRLRVFS
jgi:hypothetical protein